MKKIGFIILIIALCLSLCPLALADSYAYDPHTYVTDLTLEQDSRVIAAIYDSNGKMIEIVSKNLSAKTYSNCSFYFLNTLSDKETFSLFTVSLDSFNPIKESVNIAIEGHTNEEETIIGYYKNIVNNYDAAINSYTSKYGEISTNVKQILNKVRELCNKAIKDHNTGKAITKNYVQSAYATDINEIKDIKNKMTSDEKDELTNVAVPTMELSSHFKAILNYFGISY